MKRSLTSLCSVKRFSNRNIIISNCHRPSAATAIAKSSYAPVNISPCNACPMGLITRNFSNCPLQGSCLLFAQHYASTSAAAAAAVPRCDKCGEEFTASPNHSKDLLICGKCKSIRAPTELLNYFDLLARGKASFDMDLAMVKKEYLALQRIFHPDRYSGLDPEVASRGAFWSVTLNKAYETLCDPLRRAIYLFNILNVHSPYDEEHCGSALDETELLEILELREQIEESTTTDKCQRLCQDANQARRRITDGLQTAFSLNDFSNVRHLIDYLKFYETIQEAATLKLSILVGARQKGHNINDDPEGL